MAIAAVSIAPVGVGTHLAPYVAAALAPLRAQERVRWRLDAMFTTLEGDVGEILALVQRMTEAVFAAGAVRVSTVLKIDDRRDERATFESKLEAVRALGGPVEG